MITPVKAPNAPIIYAKPKKQPTNNKKNTVLANGTADDKTQGLSDEEQTKLKNGKDPQKASLQTLTNGNLALDHANSDHCNHDGVYIVDNVPITNTEGDDLNVVTNTTVDKVINNPTATTIPTTTICTTTATTSANNIPVATLVTIA